MAKKIKFESFRYRLLIAAENARFELPEGRLPSWSDFVRRLEFSYHKGSARIRWQLPVPGEFTAVLDGRHFCLRGDDATHASYQRASGLTEGEDPIKLDNANFFSKVVTELANSAGYQVLDPERSGTKRRLSDEREFHDSWAASTNIADIDVRAANEACTAPEIRYITKRLGDLRGKRLLDLGCGLGEVSVYFATQGAQVTACDLSSGMLDASSRLAVANGVRVSTHLADAEDLRLPADSRFDIIYAGNLLHHVDIDRTLAKLKPHLAPGGTLVTWDPLAYNPVINAYRRIATQVRTADEHPLTWRDIGLFRRHFRTVETRYFWLTSLTIFLIMALIQHRDPNRERFWKVVVKEGENWRWLYQPLEALDRFLLGLLPPLRLLCWNVVVISKA